MSIDNMLADYVIAIEGHPDIDIVQFERMGRGEWAVQRALRLSDVLRRMKLGQVSYEERLDYHQSTNPRASGNFRAQKGQYQIGMVVGLEHILQVGRRSRNAQVTQTGADAVIQSLFEGRAPRYTTFNQLLINYLQSYHPDKV